jgi:hypothetical protein
MGGMYGAAAGGPGGGDQSISGQCKNCWAAIPLFARFIFTLTILLQIVAMFYPPTLAILACVP